MDAGGIDVQVLSLNQPAAENLEPELAVKLAAMANDKIAAAVTTHPTRFGGFATLPMPNPKASAAEFERMVTNHGFLGALIHGHIRGRYLDDQFFWPVFEMAEKLDVPIYLHPKRILNRLLLISGFWRHWGATTSTSQTDDDFGGA